MVAFPPRLSTALLVVLAVAVAAEAAPAYEYPACKGEAACKGAHNYITINGVEFCCFQGSISANNFDGTCSVEQHCAQDTPVMNGTNKATGTTGVGT